MLSLFPESFHPRDNERFYSFVLSLLKTKEDLTTGILTNAVREEKKWNEESVNEFVNTFIEKYFGIKRFWEFVMVHDNTE